MTTEILSEMACAPSPLSSCDSRIRLIAVTGGIGSGKSVVCRMLHAMGYKVYDCDSRARRLMDESERIIAAIGERVARQAISCDADGHMRVDRRVLADIVFSDSEKLAALNAIVHGEVRSDLARWCVGNLSGVPALGTHHPVLMFVESAIVLESGLHNMVDAVWSVNAPDHLRLVRAMGRDNASADAIKARMRNQSVFPDDVTDARGRHIPVSVIVNDDRSFILSRIEALLAQEEQRATAESK